VNIDLPWNPAKLEQRIARAWRKGQVRGVTVINLVCEDSIEHGMVHLLGAKQALADGVLDGQGDLAALKMPSGRGAMVERMQALMQAAGGVTPPTAPPGVPSAEDTITADLRQSHGERALLVEAHQGEDGRVRVLAVLDLDPHALKAEARKLAAAGDGGPSVEIIDRATWLALRRLQASGMIQIAGGVLRVLHRASGLADTEAEELGNALKARMATFREQADRALRMARVLAAGGFPEEAGPQLANAIGFAASARLAVLGELSAEAAPVTPEQIRALVGRASLPVPALAIIEELAVAAGKPSAPGFERLLKATEEVLSACFEDAGTMDAAFGVQSGSMAA